MSSSKNIEGFVYIFKSFIYTNALFGELTGAHEIRISVKEWKRQRSHKNESITGI